MSARSSIVYSVWVLKPQPLESWRAPSTWRLAVDPRTLNVTIWFWRVTVRPGVCSSTSVSVCSLKSSMRWRVNTETDCGVSRSDSARPVAAPLGPAAV